MAIKAILLGGDPQMWDYPYSAAVLGGDVVIDSGQNIPVVAHRDYDPNAADKTIAPQAAIKGGIYKLDKSGSSGPVFAFGDAVYVHATNGATTNDANAHFGMCVKAAGASQAWVEALHQPNVGTASS
jgi:hypothetical protein